MGLWKNPEKATPSKPIAPVAAAPAAPKRPRGRPCKTTEELRKQRQFRLSDAEYAEVCAAAERDEMRFTEWVRELALKEARKNNLGVDV